MRSKPGAPAVLLRSGALALIFWQLRLLVTDLADPPVFAAALGLGFLAAWGLYRKEVRPIQAGVILALIPWLIRLGIAFPRIFFGGTAVLLDTLLLHFDRNIFIVLIPFYWTGVSTYWCARSRTFLHADIIIGDTILVTLFSVAPTADIELYRWPVLMISIFGVILFLQILGLIFSAPPEFKVRRREQVGGACALFIPVLIGGVLFLGPFQEKAVDHGGGLLAPNLFTFDFSQFLHLENEISMSDDLAFIVRKDSDDTNTLLRRYVLSGYNRKQGFFRYDLTDEKAHPQRIPAGKTVLKEPQPGYRYTAQEYYLVNLESAACIGMNEPVEITPFETWDASSFNAAYRVQSRVPEPPLFRSTLRGQPNPLDLGLSPEAYALYTEYGKDERIAGLARQITAGYDTYQDKIDRIGEYLKQGDYRYSLKPGIAPDGDQLGYFLFQSKKGYCSYYAFSMALLLRSLGIPARVAAGFTIENAPYALNYYPVRANMAHAWVEVWYPDAEWINYDPTTKLLAEGELFDFSAEMPQEFEILLKEILSNHKRLIPKELIDPSSDKKYVSAGMKVIWEYRGILGIFFLAVVFVFIRLRYWCAFLLTTGVRKKANRLWAHTKVRLALGGYKKQPQEAESEWAKRIDRRIPGVYAIYQGTAAARYAREYFLKDLLKLEQQYRNFSSEYTQGVPFLRRLLAWAAPPIALLLKNSGKTETLLRKKTAAAVVLLFFAFCNVPIEAQYTEDADRETLYVQALESQQAEQWEQAVELYADGLERYPDDPRFPAALGELYYKRRLYGLARDYYRKAERITPGDTDVLYQLSRTAAHLNRDEESAAYLEQVLRREPDNQKAIGNLGWIYFKLHRLTEGRELLESALKKIGPNPDFSMTLGTIYAFLFQYEDAKAWYLEAIAQGEALGDRRFTAVSHYNLALLETRFYQFDRALERTNASLRSLDRATGRLARGELFLKQLRFKQAFADYQAAYDLESTSVPLSKVNLAQAYQRAGRLDEARLYAEDCLQGADHSWMLNYGIDPVRYKQDLHDLLYKVYAGLEETEFFSPDPGGQAGVYRLFRKASYWYKKEVHRRLFRKYSLLSANRYTADAAAGGESNLDALLQYSRAFGDYPRRALLYLRKAAEWEVPLIPEAALTYQYEAGKLLKDGAVLGALVPQFHPVWQRDLAAECLTALAKIKPRSPEAAAAAESAYALNPGALRQNGIRLPLELAVSGASPQGGKKIRAALAAAGINPLPEGDEASRFRLGIQINDYGAACELRDKTRNNTLLFRHHIFLNSSADARQIFLFSKELTNRIFTAEFFS